MPVRGVAPVHNPPLHRDSGQPESARYLVEIESRDALMEFPCGSELAARHMHTLICAGHKRGPVCVRLWRELKRQEKVSRDLLESWDSQIADLAQTT